MHLSSRGKGGRQPEGCRFPGRKTDSRGGTKRETLIDGFSKRGRCFGLNFARGVFYFRFLFGDFGCKNTPRDTSPVLMALKTIRALRARECRCAASLIARFQTSGGGSKRAHGPLKNTVAISPHLSCTASCMALSKNNACNRSARAARSNEPFYAAQPTTTRAG
jgi:hypothetical protein